MVKQARFQKNHETTFHSPTLVHERYNALIICCRKSKNPKELRSHSDDIARPKISQTKTT
jgi:hypothetical protein